MNDWPQNPGFVTGDLKIAAYITPDAGWLLCDASDVSRTTYAALYAKLVWSLGTFTVTIASPGVFTLSAHGLAIGDAVFLTTTGALPTGLSANTTYYVATVPSSSTFTLATSLANALAGTRINTSGSQSGTHTIYRAPHGIADSTTFKLPDFRGRAAAGYGTGDASGATNHPYGSKLGKETHGLASTEMPPHVHTYAQLIAGSGIANGTNYAGTVSNTGSTGGSGGVVVAHENRTPLVAVSYFIKT